MGSKQLRKLQLGKESVAGTAVAATTIWRGQGTIEDTLVTNFVPEQVGLIMPTDRMNISALGAKLKFDSIVGTFEQLPHLFEAGVKKVTSGTSDGVGSGKIYTYPIPTTAIPTIQTYTIEGGDDAGAERMEYAFTSKITIEGKAKEELKVSAEWMGRQVAVNAFTGALSLPTVEDILTSKGKVYLDASGGSFGSTQYQATITDFSLEYTTGWVPRFTIDGNLYFTVARLTKPEVKLSITMEHVANAITEKANWRTKVARLIRLEFAGAALGTPGTAYSTKIFRIDLAGRWDKFDALSDQDGNDIVVGKFTGGYSATAGTAGQFVIVNEVATLP